MGALVVNDMKHPLLLTEQEEMERERQRRRDLARAGLYQPDPEKRRRELESLTNGSY
jgi:hypothetical protein